MLSKRNGGEDVTIPKVAARFGLSADTLRPKTKKLYQSPY